MRTTSLRSTVLRSSTRAARRSRKPSTPVPIKMQRSGWMNRLGRSSSGRFLSPLLRELSGCRTSLLTCFLWAQSLTSQPRRAVTSTHWRNAAYPLPCLAAPQADSTHLCTTCSDCAATMPGHHRHQPSRPGYPPSELLWRAGCLRIFRCVKALPKTRRHRMQNPSISFKTARRSCSTRAAHCI